MSGSEACIVKKQYINPPSRRSFLLFLFLLRVYHIELPCCLVYQAFPVAHIALAISHLLSDSSFFVLSSLLTFSRSYFQSPCLAKSLLVLILLADAQLGKRTIVLGSSHRPPPPPASGTGRLCKPPPPPSLLLLASGTGRLCRSHLCQW